MYIGKYASYRFSTTGYHEILKACTDFYLFLRDGFIGSVVYMRYHIVF